MADKVEPDVAGREGVPAFFVPSGTTGLTPRECPYAGQELGEGERFGEGVLGAGVEALYAVFDLVAGGQQQDRGTDLPALKFRTTCTPLRSGASSRGLRDRSSR